MVDGPTSVHASVAAALVEQGLATLFGLVGEGNIHLVGDLVDRHGVRYIKATREDGAVLMANGHAAVTGEVAFATVTHGPGLTNTITALVQGVRNRAPVVLIAGDTDASLPDGRQRIDQAALVAATGAGFRKISSASSAADDVVLAIAQARAERRPVVLDLPVDVQRMALDVASAHLATTAMFAVDPDPGEMDSDALDQAVGMIASAKRPVVLAGRGAVLSGARASLVTLAARIGAPLSTTLLAKDLFAGEPYDLGLYGSLAHGVAVETILAADCVLAFGAGLNTDTSAAGSLLAGKQIVQVDQDPAQLGRRTPVSVAVQGDVGLAATVMTEWLDRLGHTPSTTLCTDELRSRLDAYRPEDECTPDESGRVDNRRLVIALDRTFPPDRTFVSDTGRFMVPGLKWIRVPEPMAYVQTVDFGSIGLGVGTAIGAAIARPDRPVLLAVGDGGLAMQIGELLTAVRYGLDLVVVVFNDSAYGAEVSIVDRHGIGADLAALHETDFASIARGMGADALTIRCDAELTLMEAAIADRSGPLLIDARTDPRTPIPS